MSLFDELLYQSLFSGYSMMQASQQTLQMFQPAPNWISRPRDTGCMVGSMAGGSAAGLTGVALVGLAGGPFAEVTVPIF